MKSRDAHLAARPRLSGAGLWLVALALVAGACRSSRGEPCRCASDCKSGLECFAEGEGVVEGDACFKAGVLGVCITAESIDSDSGAAMLSDMPIREDFHSKRDLAGPDGTGTDSDSGTTAAPTTDATGTGTTSTGTTSSTGTTTSTGTSTTDTGTSTTGTSTTGTTTDTSTTGTSTTGTSSTGSSSTGSSTT